MICQNWRVRTASRKVRPGSARLTLEPVSTVDSASRPRLWRSARPRTNSSTMMVPNTAGMSPSTT